MDGIKSSLDDIEMSLKRLASAVDALELAADRRMRHDEARATEQEEYALMQDDRSRLAVELDGAPHDRDGQKAHDASRDAWLREHGYRILRLRNELVIGGGNIPLDMIRAAIAEIEG